MQSTQQPHPWSTQLAAASNSFLSRVCVCACCSALLWAVSSVLKVCSVCCTDTPAVQSGVSCVQRFAVGPEQHAPVPWGPGFEFRYLTEFQSHEPEFDYLKSVEIEEGLNQVRWLCSVEFQCYGLFSHRIVHGRHKLHCMLTRVLF
jgi:hypothetical protein